MKDLIKIQNELKAPKSQYNAFGKYNYRNCEDILEAAKPILQKYNCFLTVSDEIVMIGERYYVKATATIMSEDRTQYVSTTAYAREEENKKGMDASQVTGATSSYARKYALNGLFCIDDTKDADFNNQGEDKQKEAPKGKSKQLTNRDKVIILAEERGISMQDLAKQYNLNGNTTDKRFAEVLAEMEGGNGEA